MNDQLMFRSDNLTSGNGIDYIVNGKVLNLSNDEVIDALQYGTTPDEIDRIVYHIVTKDFITDIANKFHGIMPSTDFN